MVRFTIELAMSKLEFSLHTIDIGHFEMACETGSVLCRITLWDCFGARSLTLVMSNKRNRSVPKALPWCNSTQNRPFQLSALACSRCSQSGDGSKSSEQEKHWGVGLGRWELRNAFPPFPSPFLPPYFFPAISYFAARSTIWKPRSGYLNLKIANKK